MQYPLILAGQKDEWTWCGIPVLVNRESQEADEKLLLYMLPSCTEKVGSLLYNVYR